MAPETESVTPTPPKAPPRPRQPGLDRAAGKNYKYLADDLGKNGPQGSSRAAGRRRHEQGATYAIWGLPRIAEAVGVSVVTIRDYTRTWGFPMLLLGGHYVTTRGLIDLWILTKIRERG